MSWGKTGEDEMFYGTGNYVCQIALRREAYRDGKGNTCTCHLMHEEWMSRAHVGSEGDREICLPPDAWGMEGWGIGDCACHIMHGDGK